MRAGKYARAREAEPLRTQSRPSVPKDQINWWDDFDPHTKRGRA